MGVFILRTVIMYRNADLHRLGSVATASRSCHDAPPRLQWASWDRPVACHTRCLKFRELSIAVTSS